MKKILIFITVLCMLSACKNVLDKQPLDQIGEGNFWNTKEDLETYLNQFYNSIPFSVNGGWGVGPYGIDANSDNMVAGEYNTHHNGETFVPGSGGGWEWEKVRAVNYFLEQAPNVTGVGAEAIIGEGYFFRAVYYFNLLRKFGDLPWIDKPLDIDAPELYDGRLKRNIIADHIIADLDEAISRLPMKSGDKSGRVHKGIALAFKSRVALYEGTWEKHHAKTVFGVEGSDGTAFLRHAADAAWELINPENGYGYAIDGTTAEDYGKLFNQTDLSSNTGVIWFKLYSQDMGTAHNLGRTVGANGTPNNRGLTRSLLRSFLNADGTVWVETASNTDSIEAELAGRDPRMAQIFNHRGVLRHETPGKTIYYRVAPYHETTANGLTTGYTMNKPRVYKTTNIDDAWYDETVNPIFRYAEVLLNYAEAKEELGEFDQGIADMTINKLRKRAGVAPMVTGAIDDNAATYYGYAVSPDLREIRRERRVEFANEGYRKDDIYRWAAAGALIRGWKPRGIKFAESTNIPVDDATFTPKVDENNFVAPFDHVGAMENGYQFDVNRDYLSPLPDDQLTINDKLKQNPGWE